MSGARRRLALLDVDGGAALLTKFKCAPRESSRRKVPPSRLKDCVAQRILGLAATAHIATACIHKTMRNRVEPLLRPYTCVWATSARRHEHDEVSKLCDIPLSHGECLF